MNTKFSQYDLVTFMLLFTMICAPVFANLEFYSYNKTTYNNKVKWQLIQLGTVQLNRVDLNIIPKGSLLDITETATLSGNLNDNQISNLLQDEFLFKGNLPIPLQSVVVGLSTWIDNTQYKAQLKPAGYSYDQSFPDSLSLVSSLREKLAYLQKLSEGNYEATFTGVKLGQERGIRIRYLLPNTAKASNPVRIPILFHNHDASMPQNVMVTLAPDKTGRTYAWIIKDKKIIASAGQTLTLTYHDHLILQPIDTVKNILITTKVTDPNQKGTYIKVNASMDSSLYTKLIQPLECMIVWRWNEGLNFITQPSGYPKQLSSQALDAIAAAKKILELSRRLGSGGIRVGLAFSEEGKPIEIIPPCSKNSTAWLGLETRLNKFTKEWFYNTYRNVQAIQNPDPMIVLNGPDQREKGFVEFKGLLKMLSDTMNHSPNTFRHLIGFSLGSVPNTLDDSKQILMDSLMNTAQLTADLSLFEWKGLINHSRWPSSFNQTSISFDAFKFPPFHPSSIQLNIKDAQHTWTFPIERDTSKFVSTIIKTHYSYDTSSKDSANPSVYWIGLNSQGMEMVKIPAAITQKSLPEDSALAKLWAGDDNRISLKPEIELASRYGIVNKSAYLQAGISAPTSAMDANLDYLLPDEILIPITAITKKTSNNKYFAWSKSSLTVDLSHVALWKFALRNTLGLVLTIYDSKGRILLNLSLEKIIDKNGRIILPLSLFPKTKNNLIFVIKSSFLVNSLITHSPRKH